MSVKKYKTTLYDILQSVIGMYDYDVKILESEKRMIISIKVWKWKCIEIYLY